MKFPLCEVEWVDAMSFGSEYAHLNDAQKLSGVPAQTVGYLIKQDKESVRLCMTYFGETEASEESFKFLWAIPRRCIKSIRVILEKD